MKKCDYCGTRILFGEVRDGRGCFCDGQCRQNGALLRIAQMAPEVVEREAEDIFRSQCPICNGPGPVDIHRVYYVYSVLVMTRWSTSLQVSCHACATKRQLGATALCTLLGWWGFPWGLFVTPVQICRNIRGIWHDSKAPSTELRHFVQLNRGAELLRARAR
jgi:hypothetical protein